MDTDFNFTDNRGMKWISVILLIGWAYSWTESLATVTSPNLPPQGVLSPDKEGFLDDRIDYSKFGGRVTDKDDTGNILKVKVENNNTKFFKIGDEVSFHLPNRTARRLCQAQVRAVEEFYFSVYVKDFSLCYDEQDYFKRGTQLNFISEVLARRIYEASHYRTLLIKRRQDMLRQLNDINHFVWSYDQEKIKVVADYDKRILDLQRAKERALDDLVAKNRESAILQTDLKKKLDLADESLRFYRIERQELMTDRWNTDHDFGLPVGQRPQEIKARNE